MHVRSRIHPSESLPHSPFVCVSLQGTHDSWILKHSLFHIISIFSNNESKKEKEKVEKHSGACYVLS